MIDNGLHQVKLVHHQLHSSGIQEPVRERQDASFKREQEELMLLLCLLMENM
jgi:hypothetical protein